MGLYQNNKRPEKRGFVVNYVGGNLGRFKMSKERLGTTREKRITCPYCGYRYEENTPALVLFTECENCRQGFYCRKNITFEDGVRYDTSSQPFDDDVSKSMETNHISNGVRFITNEIVTCNKCGNTSNKVVKIEMDTGKNDLILYYGCMCGNTYTLTYKLEDINKGLDLSAKLDAILAKELECTGEVFFRDRKRFLLVDWLLENNSVEEVLREIIKCCIRNGVEKEEGFKKLRFIIDVLCKEEYTVRKIK